MEAAATGPTQTLMVRVMDTLVEMQAEVVDFKVLPTQLVVEVAALLGAARATAAKVMTVHLAAIELPGHMVLVITTRFRVSPVG